MSRIKIVSGGSCGNTKVFVDDVDISSEVVAVEWKINVRKAGVVGAKITLISSELEFESDGEVAKTPKEEG